MPLFSSFSKDRVFPAQPGDKSDKIRANQSANEYMLKGTGVTKQQAARPREFLNQESKSRDLAALTTRNTNDGHVQATNTAPLSAQVSVQLHSDTLFGRVFKTEKPQARQAGTPGAKSGVSLAPNTVQTCDSQEVLKAAASCMTSNPSQCLAAKSGFVQQRQFYALTLASTNEDTQSKTSFKKTSQTGVRSAGFFQTVTSKLPVSLEGTFRHQPPPAQASEEFPVRNTIKGRHIPKLILP